MHGYGQKVTWPRSGAYKSPVSVSLCLLLSSLSFISYPVFSSSSSLHHPAISLFHRVLLSSVSILLQISSALLWSRFSVPLWLLCPLPTAFSVACCLECKFRFRLLLHSEQDVLSTCILPILLTILIFCPYLVFNMVATSKAEPDNNAGKKYCVADLKRAETEFLAQCVLSTDADGLVSKSSFKSNTVHNKMPLYPIHPHLFS